MRRPYRLIADKNPALRFEFARWKREIVRKAVSRELGVGLSLTSVGRLLKRLGLSPQRPTRRADVQDAEAIRPWKEQLYPLIAQETH